MAVFLKILVAKWRQLKGLVGLSVMVSAGRCTCANHVNGVTRTKTDDMAAAKKVSCVGSQERIF